MVTTEEIELSKEIGVRRFDLLADGEIALLETLSVAEEESSMSGFLDAIEGVDLIAGIEFISCSGSHTLVSVGGVHFLIYQ